MQEGSEEVLDGRRPLNHAAQKICSPSDEEASRQRPLSPLPISGYPSRKRNRHKLYVYFLLLVFAAFLFTLAVKNLSISKGDSEVTVSFTSDRPLPHDSDDTSLYLKSLPTARFRGNVRVPKGKCLNEPIVRHCFIDNLVDGVKYVTAWPIEGFTNQFMAQVNLLYLAYLAGRVPVLPSFAATERHMGSKDPGPLAVSEVFDLLKLAKELRRPILEWQDVKNMSLHEVEDIGCWSVFKTAFDKEPHFRSERDLFLDVSFTKVPDSAKFSPARFHTNVMSLASLGWTTSRTDALRGVMTSSSPLHKHILPPDETLLCFDNLYYVGAANDFEWEQAWSPSWNLVGRYMGFTPRIEELTHAFILRAFGLTPTDTIPSYISVHVRHTDFNAVCNNKPWKHCFAPLSAFAERVREIQTILESDHDIIVDKVLITSDEKNQTWWDGVRELGWVTLDHKEERTVEIYGSWYPIILDSAALALARGFVGTKGSTMSLLASKRVQLWANGPVTDVPIGEL